MLNITWQYRNNPVFDAYHVLNLEKLKSTAKQNVPFYAVQDELEGYIDCEERPEITKE
jgi:hypothetical protein